MANVLALNYTYKPIYNYIYSYGNHIMYGCMLHLMFKKIKGSYKCLNLDPSYNLHEIGQSTHHQLTQPYNETN